MQVAALIWARTGEEGSECSVLRAIFKVKNSAQMHPKMLPMRIQLARARIDKASQHRQLSITCTWNTHCPVYEPSSHPSVSRLSVLRPTTSMSAKITMKRGVQITTGRESDNAAGGVSTS